MNLIKINKKEKIDNSYFKYKDLLNGNFWSSISAYQNINETKFLDWKWQSVNTITKPNKLLDIIKHLTDDTFIKDVEEGFIKAPMSLRVSPYILSLINWEDPYNDPLRIQFIPVGSKLLEDHPGLTLDSLHEQKDSPVPGLTHRYKDKVLFLPLNTCPVYCRFCTRSYAVGPDNEQIEKLDLRIDEKRWDQCFDYINTNKEIEDVVISGGDSYMLKPKQILTIGNRLLEMDNIRRMRFATKGPAVMPMKLITDLEWVDSLYAIVERGRKLGKDVMLHTHFNHPNEITWISQKGIQNLFERGIHIRNQTVLQKNVNDTFDSMCLLIKRLSFINVHPYYVYLHDLVKGVEDLRTPLQTALDLEKNLRGITSGFNMPNFIVDAPGGGGKRIANSFEYYDKDTGVSIYKAPAVKKDELFFYFDPINSLPISGQVKWNCINTKEEIINNVINLMKQKNQ